MNARTALRLAATLSAAAWALAWFSGNTAGGWVHLLAAAAMVAFVAQARIPVILTPFEAWQVREVARRAASHR
ncbi:MAG: hypothetical protein JST54_11695 [Deltaproteobacteria bacterium]|nr:hypothetical protein [Deltaproteobacteria bacterium]